jgi:hypothetical protein
MLTVLTLLLALITAAVVVVVASIRRSGREDSRLLGSIHINVKLSDL